jgi:bacteriocin-like protein
MISDDSKDAAKAAETTKQDPAATELTEKDLDQVAGGFNPQPDPPGRAQ